MVFLRVLTILCLFNNSVLSFCQDTIVVNGYVIDDTHILPEVLVSVAHKKTSTTTNFKGRFKIECVIGDTLVFELKYPSYYKIEKYLVKDNSLLIIRLIREIKFSKDGKHQLAYSLVEKINKKHSAHFSGSISDKHSFSAGTDYFPEPFFPDKNYIPIMNAISFGMDISKMTDEFYLFPNLGFYLRTNYEKAFGSNFSISFLAPSLKLGYYLRNFNNGNNGFGYELAIPIINFSFRNLHYKNFTVDAKYNNYLSTNGTFMLGLHMNFYSKTNKIPPFIKKQISK